MNAFFKGKINKTNFLLLALVFLLAGIFLTACNNEIFESWWEENDFDYVAIIKDLPLYVYETIMEEKIIYETIFVQLPPEIKIVYVDKPLPPEVLLQHINILEIQYVIFSGESTQFNEPSPAGGTNLTPQEVKTNTAIIDYIAKELKDHDNYFMIFHGHANALTGTAEEAKELERISLERAEATTEKLYDVYENVYGNSNNDLDKRVTKKGYGGGRNISGSTSSYAGLNRRVEAILFKIETEKVKQDKGR